VSQNGCFGGRGRAARVEEDGDPLWVVRPLLTDRTDCRRCQPVVPVDHRMVDACQAGLGQLVRDDQDVLMLVEQAGHLFMAQPVIDGQHRDAGPGAGEHGDGEGGRVGADVSNVGDAVPPDPGCSDAGPPVELLIAEPIVAAADGHTGGVAGHGHIEQHHEIHCLEFLCFNRSRPGTLNDPRTEMRSRPARGPARVRWFGPAQRGASSHQDITMPTRRTGHLRG